jgi:NAD(P)-dependent dehydrogenase (short-subunit alcohol dehydrogenase family)
MLTAMTDYTPRTWFIAVEEAGDEQARGIFDTNVFGVLNVLRATLRCAARRVEATSSRVLHATGGVAHPGVGPVTATKYAVEGLTDALVGELEPLGVKVTPSTTPTASHWQYSLPSTPTVRRFVCLPAASQYGRSAGRSKRSSTN